MAKKLTTTSKAPIAAETGTAILGTAQAAATPPIVAADPSGMNGPDGTVLEGEVLPTDTPQSESGSVVDAESTVSEIPQDNDQASGPVTEFNPEAPALASGTDINPNSNVDDVVAAGIPFPSAAIVEMPPASWSASINLAGATSDGEVIVPATEGAVVEVPQGTDGGVAVMVDAAPGSTDTALDVRGLKHALELTGCTDIDDLIDKADIGRSFVAAVAAHSALGILKGWVPGDDPVAVVGHLVALATTLENQIEALRAARVADTPRTVRIEKRRFIVTGRVRQDNVLKDIGSTVDLTEEEHAEMLGTLAIASAWDEGFTV